MDSSRAKLRIQGAKQNSDCKKKQVPWTILSTLIYSPDLPGSSNVQMRHTKPAEGVGGPLHNAAVANAVVVDWSPPSPESYGTVEKGAGGGPIHNAQSLAVTPVRFL